MSSLDGNNATRGGDEPALSTKWPAWFYTSDNTAPEGFRGEIFENADEVPAGWESHPSKLKPSKAAKDAKTADPYKDWSDDQVKEELGKNEIKFDQSWSGDKLKAVLRASVDKK